MLNPERLPCILHGTVKSTPRTGVVSAGSQMRLFSGKVLLLTVSLFALAACGDAPGGAPQAKEILRGAQAEDADFAVVPVTRATLPQLSKWPQSSSQPVSGWLEKSSGPASQIIQAGDMLDLSIWDNGESSLLAQKGQKAVELRSIRVSSAGDVFLPYVDQVYVAKMTPDAARETIQKRFAEISTTAQVQLNHQPGRESSVDLISGVSKPGNFPLPDRNVSVLSLIALGGGVEAHLTNPQVRLMRGSKLYGISLDRLLKSPALDTTLRGGDKVFVESDERYFLSLGAASKEAQIPFPDDQVTALDAASLIGGFADNRANPKGVLVLRNYDGSDVRSDGTGPSKERTIFSFDLTSADGLFSAGEFQIANKDLVLVTESSVVQNGTVISVMYDALGIGLRARSLRN